jgi:hypothetical protein
LVFEVAAQANPVSVLIMRLSAEAASVNFNNGELLDPFPFLKADLTIQIQHSRDKLWIEERMVSCSA